MVLNNHFEAPYHKFAAEGPVPIISKSLVKSRLSNKFYEMTNSQMGGDNKVNPFTESKNESNVNMINFNDGDKLSNEITRLKNRSNSIGMGTVTGKENAFSTGNNEKVKETNYENDLENLKEVIMKLKNETKVNIYFILFILILFLFLVKR